MLYKAKFETYKLYNTVWFVHTQRVITFKLEKEIENFSDITRSTCGAKRTHSSNLFIRGID